MPRLADHVRGATNGADLFILDVANDRYLGLPDAVPESGGVLLGGWLRIHSDAVEALGDAGLLTSVEGKSAEPLTLPDRVVSREAQASSRPTLLQITTFLSALVATGWRVWRGSPCRHHALARTTQDHPTPEPVVAARLAVLDTLRLVIPTPRRCLPAALFTCLWLRRQGVAAEIVFGIRSHPFEAHCWAEHAGIVLDDDLERLRGFTPLAVAIP